jgi:hypothetical protein
MEPDGSRLPLLSRGTGISCVLVGTGNSDHLAQNIADIAKVPPERDRAVLADLFALVDSESGTDRPPDPYVCSSCCMEVHRAILG